MYPSKAIVPAAFAVALSAFSVGCGGGNLGELTPTGGGVSGPLQDPPTDTGSCGSEGRAYFEANVLPIVDNGETGAMCATCHLSSYKEPYAPKFLGSSREGIYDALVANKKHVSASIDSSIFLNRGQHTGPAFSSEQHEKVAKWLTIEASERFSDCSEETVPSEPSPSGKEAVKEFGDCMTLDDWMAAGMHKFSTQSTLAGPCFSCHQHGTGGNYMTNPEEAGGIEEGFNKMKVLSPILNLVTWTVNDEGAFEDLVPADRWRDKSGEGGHPQYFLDPQHGTALDTWFKLTYDKWKSGSCVFP